MRCVKDEKRKFCPEVLKAGKVKAWVLETASGQFLPGRGGSRHIFLKSFFDFGIMSIRYLRQYKSAVIPVKE